MNKIYWKTNELWKGWKPPGNGLSELLGIVDAEKIKFETIKGLEGGCFQ